mmetsp:Transcript_47590/g.101845  ORF Transcript_47590/g.101845 Transcript_47590/m.101845 type:complete len:628 (+) Transcript_47590:217-2100(+)
MSAEESVNIPEKAFPPRVSTSSAPASGPASSKTELASTWASAPSPEVAMAVLHAADQNASPSSTPMTAAAAAAQSLPTRSVSSSSVPRCTNRGGPSKRLYVDDAAHHFGQPFAHRLRWMHAVNSHRRLDLALKGDAHLLEGDVSMGPLVRAAAPAGTKSLADCPSSSSDAKDSTPRTSDTSEVGGEEGNGLFVIMAHYPTERSSDLSLANFVDRVLSHNDNCKDKPDSSPDGSAAASTATSSTARPPRHDDEDALTNQEAKDFAAELEEELDVMCPPLLQACAGSRKKPPTGRRRTGWKKGIKLDFKHFACVEPTVAYLRKVKAAERLQGHLWLNADILIGPGAMMTPLDAQKFVRLCAEQLPEAVLSLGWGTTFLSTTRSYTSEMIDRMIELCMTPLVRLPPPWELSSPSAGNEGSEPSEIGGSSSSATSKRFLPEVEDDYRKPLAAVCTHVTFAVAAEYALASAPNLKRLLDYIPGASLTIYSGVGSLGVATATVQEFVKTFGLRRCFFDLKVTRPWRWIFGGRSCLQAPVDAKPALTDSLIAASSADRANEGEDQQQRDQNQTSASSTPTTVRTTSSSLPASALAAAGAHSAAGNPRLMRPVGKQSKPKAEADQDHTRLIAIVD